MNQAPAARRLDLSEKTALVTGAGQGLGRAIALELARAGASIIVADLSLQRAQAVADEISGTRTQALGVRIDVTQSDSISAGIEQAVKINSQLHILVNNAGIFQRSLGLDQDEEDFSRGQDVNLTGVWRMVRAIVPHFKGQGGGKIVNIASVGGRQGVDFACGYCASKAAVINLTQSLAMALGSHNINVNTVCPGSIWTAMHDEIKSLRNHAGEKHELSILPLARPLTAEDVGHAVVFFSSAFASNITGQALNVDCGSIMS